jgi:hypothetical protein
LYPILKLILRAKVVQVRDDGVELSSKREGIKPWLDEDQIRPGTSWQTVLGEQIGSIKSAAVFMGKNGIGPWQDEYRMKVYASTCRNGRWMVCVAHSTGLSGR